MKLKDKVAVITGGTAGLGSATVKRFLDEGAKVVFSYRSGRERAEEMLEELAGCPVDAFQADVSVSEQVQALIQHTIDKFGRIDILVNNAESSTRGKISLSFLRMNGIQSWIPTAKLFSLPANTRSPICLRPVAVR